MLEHIISKRLKSFLHDNNILTDKQHGFRKGRSTLSAIIEFLNIIYNNVNDNFDSYIIYLDLKKAFDTVSHNLLLNKLVRLGLMPRTVSWFDSYLLDRVQRTKINDACSTYLTVPYGVPQGSILGPTLFSLYINDLVYFVNCDMIFYADDTVILSKDPILLHTNLNRIYNWCNQNYLTINIKKSQWMRSRLVDKNIIPGTGFDLGGEELTMVEEYKYLGVQMDPQLNFHAHRQSLINNINYKLVFFKKIRKYITVDAAKMIYKGTILPVLEYADFVFDYGIKYVNKKWQTLQNQGLYIVFDQHYMPYELKDSTETIHKDANLIRLDHRRKIHMLAFIFNYRNTEELLDLRDLLTRRHDGLLFKETQIVHHKVKQNPFYRAIKMWNELPVQIRSSDSKENFKQTLLLNIQNPFKKIP